MENLVKAGVDMFDVDLGCYDNWWLPHPPAGMPAGCFLDVAKVAKDYFAVRQIKSNAGVEIPIVAVGKLGYPDLAEQALRDGKCDMVMLGRPVLADPDWCNKAYAGKVEEIRPCIGCQEGCINEFVEGGHPQCAVNPRTGFEDVMPRKFPKADKPKRIAVVGGGCAGMNFALVAAGRGHKIDLYEKKDRLGGKLWAASTPMVKFDMMNYTRWLIAQVEKAAGVKILLNTAVDNDLLKRKGYDAVIFAVGAQGSEKLPPIPGITEAKTVDGVDLLDHPEKLGDAKKVVVIGGGSVGMETAYWLQYEHGCRVTVVEMLQYMMDGACTANRGHLIHYFEEGGGKLINCAKVVGFGKDNSVRIERNISKGVPDPYCTWTPIIPKNVENPLAPKMGTESVIETLHCDLVVLCMGRAANDAPYFSAVDAHVAPEIYNIGDSLQAGNLLTGNRAAWNIASKI
ncbi:MAG: FAD-dependent oxidoreductase [Oscillospiraceae bacterium]|nr:FAD-dependent oxidoreductase [Oscillospiraceae bacterium]